MRIFFIKYKLIHRAASPNSPSTQPMVAAYVQCYRVWLYSRGKLELSQNTLPSWSHRTNWNDKSTMDLHLWNKCSEQFCIQFQGPMAWNTGWAAYPVGSRPWWWDLLTQILKGIMDCKYIPHWPCVLQLVGCTDSSTRSYQIRGQARDNWGYCAKIGVSHR